MAKPELRYYLGCSEWKVPEWRDIFYTTSAQPGYFLEQYASVFNTAMVNVAAAPKELKEWHAEIPDEFRFCVFLPQKMIQNFWALRKEDEILDFIKGFDSFSDKIGQFMICLPEAFSPDYLPGLEKLLQILPQTYFYAVEVTHAGFFDRGNNERDLVQLLQETGTNRVICDSRKLYSAKSGSRLIAAAKNKYAPLPVRFEGVGARPVVRFVGTDVLNSEVYLTEWAIVAADWIKAGRTPYFFFDTPDIRQMPALATAFHNILSEFKKLEPLPEWPVHQKPQLGLF